MTWHDSTSAINFFPLVQAKFLIEGDKNAFSTCKVRIYEKESPQGAEKFEDVKNFL
jgi:hypothetical protein